LPAEPAKEDRYNAALLDAINRLTEKKPSEALASLEVARSIHDTEQVRQEIARVKVQLEQTAAAERTLDDIQAVLRDGKAEDAARLATAALSQYGGTDSAERLARLKRQADAMVVAQVEDQTARRARFRAEAEAALREKNLRAAAIAFEQALQFGDDPTLRQQHNETRRALTRYDENRARAAELRRDPYQLEDAIALYQEAAKAWDTLQVRQDIDECQLALSRRRDRISVADFEIRGDLGIPAAGRTIAEELLPAFKSRFDIVERRQLGKVLAELKLEASELAEGDGPRRQVGELARIRYLVLGSVTRMNGALVSARVVDVRTGLIVQTAKLTVASPEELLARLPQLAQLLMMSDDQRLAYEQHLATRPLPVAGDGLDRPLIAHADRPPDPGVLSPDVFEGIPTAPLPPGGVAVELALPLKNKFLGLSLELGDDLFKRGRFVDAIKHFEFAYGLHPDRDDIRVRLDRCRPHVPPAPPVVLAPHRPRLAIINFVPAGDPRALPPGLGSWAAEQIGPYFCPPYDVVDRGEVFWWMGQLGMTVRDLMEDPAARRYLGRALNVRAFLLGSVRPTASFDVSTHLIDAEHGFLLGAGRVHVRSPHELKLRLGELARLTLLDPRERQRFEQDREYEQILVEGRQRFERGEFSIALELFGRARKNRPFSIEVQVLVDQCESRSRLAALEEARRREYERAQAIAAEQQRRQWELARQAEAARLRAEQEAAALADAARSAHDERRLRAQQALVGQARIAIQTKNFSLSLQLFESATALQPSDELYRELALARARAEEEARAAAALDQARKEGELRRQREEQLALARSRVEESRRQRAAEEQARRAAQQQQDDAEYTRLLDAAQRFQAQQKYDQAVASLHGARRLKPTSEVERLLQAALIEQARTTAQSKDAAARAELEKQLAVEKTRREAAEAEAKKNQDLYLAALAAANQALAAKQFDLATAEFNEAGKLYNTDVVLTGLKQVEEARAKEFAVRDAILRRQVEAAKREADFKRLMSEGQAALGGRQLAKAVAAFKQAVELKPTDVEALAGLSKAEQLREEQRLLAGRKKDSEEREAAFQKLCASGQANLTAKQYDAAVAAFAEALKLKPDDATAQKGLRQVEAARSAALADASKAKHKEEEDRRQRQYQKLLGEGRAALSAKQYDSAIKAFQEAQKVLPGDQASAAFLKDAERAKQDAADALAMEAKRRADELRKRTEIDKAIAQARAALALKDLDGATKAYTQAFQLDAASPEVQQLRKDLDAAREQARQSAAEAQMKLEREKKLNQVQQLLQRGRSALAAKNVEAAANAFAEAERLAPNNAAVKQALADLASARALVQAEAKKRDEATKRPMPPAQPAKPTDTAKPSAPLPKDFAGLMQTGAAFEKQKLWNEAVQAYREAVRLSPNDAKAASALANARYEKQMTEGRDHLKARKFAEAQADFEQALRFKPKDPEATRLLDQAKRGM
jgi:tetratricopeptide (TPR) repeat protein